jgi:prolyl 4-hydroxylase
MTSTATPFTFPRLPRDVRRIQTADREVLVAMRIEQPEVALFENLLSTEECDELMELSRVKLKQSTIVDPQTGKYEVIQDRSSYGTFFNVNETPFIAKLDARIAAVMNWPVENGEGLQILNYKIGGEYKPHFDYFPPEHPGSAEHIANGGQRVSTLIIYLNDVDAGGDTIFPPLGLAIRPKKGSAVYFEYVNQEGEIDPHTLHGGAPVTHGEKWIATKWMRAGKYV